MQQFVRSKRKLFVLPFQEKMPLAVVGSNVVIEVNGKKVRGRQYPWGVAEGRFTQVHCQKGRTRFSSCGQTARASKINWKYAHFESSRGAAIKHFSSFFFLSVFKKAIWYTVRHLPWSDNDRCEKEACWRLKVDLFENVQQSQYYLYRDEWGMISLRVWDIVHVFHSDPLYLNQKWVDEQMQHLLKWTVSVLLPHRTTWSQYTCWSFISLEID